MGTLLDKINKLKETKEAIKNKLVEKGVNVSDTDTFASYADKIDEISGGITIEKKSAGTHEDVFGTYTVSTGVQEVYDGKKSYYIDNAITLKISSKVAESASLLLPQIESGMAYVEIQCDTWLRKNSASASIGYASCIIAPQGFYANVLCANSTTKAAPAPNNAFRRGIYTNWTPFSQDWSEFGNNLLEPADTVGNGDGVIIKISDYSKIPTYFYAQRMLIDLESLVTIINNIKSTTYKYNMFYIGTTNINRLTTAQKNTLTSKGWILK